MMHLSYSNEDLRLRRLAYEKARTPTAAAAAAATKARRVDLGGWLQGLGRQLRRREPTLAPRPTTTSRKG
ncbi:MAG: hypothetical protein ACLFTL_02835 [Alphaproteobacteria bacterium]